MTKTYFLGFCPAFSCLKSIFYELLHTNLLQLWGVFDKDISLPMVKHIYSLHAYWKLPFSNTISPLHTSNLFAKSAPAALQPKIW